MAVTENSYTGNGSTTNYSFTFPYLKSTDVQVQVDAAVTTAWSFANATTVQFNSAPANGAKIKILRDTNVDSLAATFYAGSAIKSEDLNDNYTQNLYKTQEVGARYFSNTGGTMTGDLTLDTGVDLIFEGATADAHETKFGVTDPTADQTYNLPNHSAGTYAVITTGDTGTVAHAMLAGDAVDGDNIANDSINSEHYVDASIDTAHIADAQITTAKIADNNVTTAKIAADAITGAKIGDDVINSEHYVAGSIDLEHMSANSVDSDQYVDGSIDTVHIADLNVTTAKIAADAITNAKIADDSIDSEHYVDGSIDTAHIASAQITDAKLASNAVTTGKITDANVTTVKIADNAVDIQKLGCQQNTITNSDSHVPTSGAVVDYVAAQIAPIGGLEVIADEDNFPTTQPSSGVVISISDAAGIVVNGSGVSTTARTAGNGSDNVTINNFPSSLYSETLASGVGLMVSSTGSSNTYNYHKILAAETDVKQLSDDINDFNARYRVNAGEPGSSNDEGDLVYDTTANKMKVYDGSSWGEVASTGEFKFLFLCPAGGSGAPTINGSIATYDLREGSNSGTAADVSTAAQLLVSVNGVIQKANSGTSAPAEGFAMVDANTIIFGANLATGDSVFIIQIGSSVTVPTPGDNTVTAAKIGSGAVTTAKIADANVTTAKLADDAVTADKLASDAVVTASIVNDAVTAAKIADDAVGAEHIEQLDADLSFADDAKAKFGASNDLEVFHLAGGDSYVDSNSGQLYVRSNNSIYIQPADNENGVVCNANGAVELYYDNSKKFETASAGCAFTGGVSGNLSAASSASTITLDMAAACHHTVTLAHNTTFADPSNEVAGQSGSIIITQDGTGSRTAAWNSAWKWTGGTAPTLSTAANAVDRIDYLVVAAGNIHAVASLDVK